MVTIKNKELVKTLSRKWFVIVDTNKL
jgi:hypothetical protein